MKKALIATVTFGHDPELLGEALAGANEAVKQNPELFDQIIIDDSSGCAPFEISYIPVLTTPARNGYAAAVNYLIDTFGDQYARLVLVNPDANPSVELIKALANSRAAVSIPKVVGRDGRIQNIRNVSTARSRVLSLAAGEGIAARVAGSQKTAEVSTGRSLSSPPLAPAGSVISFDTSELRRLPLDPQMFWIEMSDWVLRRANTTGNTLEMELIDSVVEHVGASTSVSFPISVAASQLAADCAFIKTYGSRITRTLLPIAITLRALRYLIVKQNAAAAWFLWCVGMFRKNWRVQR